MQQSTGECSDQEPRHQCFDNWLGNENHLCLSTSLLPQVLSCQDLQKMSETLEPEHVRQCIHLHEGITKDQTFHTG